MCIYMCIYIYIYTVLHFKHVIKKMLHNQNWLCHAGIAQRARAGGLCHAERTTLLSCAGWLCQICCIGLCTQPRAQLAHNQELTESGNLIF